MNRADHQLLGAAWGTGYGLALGWLHGAHGPTLAGLALGSALAASATAGGKLSPDVDQWLHRARRPLWADVLRAAWLAFAWAATRHPRWRRAVRRGDPCQHRGITHWWGAAAFGAVVLASVELGLLLAGVSIPTWPAWAALVGWCSHLAGDLVHGKRVWGQAGHGIPLAPWWSHRGVGLRSDGWTAHAVSILLAAGAGAALVFMAAGI
jgi:hypothetical protein